MKHKFNYYALVAPIYLLIFWGTLWFVTFGR
jgi:hypothetical protein